jgi:murein tripeptide amidase MpaA
MSYLNVDEVDTAVVNLSTAYPALAHLITLPHRSVEGRRCHALRLGPPAHRAHHCAVIIGGVHAREWGSCEILINLAADLLEAYSTHRGLVYGGQRFKGMQIRHLLDELSIVLFPLVNPDGRHHSQVVDPDWRKNRNPAYSGGTGNPNCVGVDINRNYDFLFDFQAAFAPASDVSIYTSADPCDKYVYHGPSPFSEPETQNVRWLLDRHPGARWFIDVHSYAEDMLYSWGDDDDQSSNASMNFHNPAYDGKRGIKGDTAYSEYIPADDLSRARSLAAAFCSGLSAVRGKSYTAKSAFDLYPTAGASDDYAYSRHFADPTKGKAFGFTVEWGTEFQPPWAEMENIIRDVCAGLIQLCVTAHQHLAPAAPTVLGATTG